MEYYLSCHHSEEPCPKTLHATARVESLLVAGDASKVLASVSFSKLLFNLKVVVIALNKPVPLNSTFQQPFQG